ncbi:MULTISPECIES: CopY/TcrY family copper transport repressor [Erysipelothrix]|uniref:CopY/TcrY family copper transport repressor n=1 Tax=Erysipelothrix piscisicarius TaxID=2485784 RepID=A0A3Q8S8B9_9FIRM|nr:MULTISPECIES: CopY/TcrY family copper transport repressor [Erysipelothrix]AZK44713.1 CopY/TcrY family copper transport repressor [Erysipelothrix piscisicarius]MBK2402999.1 CopY/TcrY family copper transport repressor [Erysipelothrix sp. strain 2 (EsS2-6-Brazil)]MBK2403505.1 CopY/TcrY family copper transport repressor [Erysipelothrix sp. strain 2 (EsS2-7-Brazil)]NBA01550.1 CopY/TcrY family copper transport repressor [Erysipelothrix rhusiopathiae]
MKDTKLVSDSEWEVLRVLWTLNHATSREVADHFKLSKNWEPATTKTLISRLVKKGYVKADTEGKAYVYRPTLSEKQGTQSRIMEAFDSICAQEVGSTLKNIIEHYELSHHDKHLLLEALNQKTSVDVVKCNCVVSCNCGQDTCTCKKA